MKNLKKTSKNKGFTLIEILVVIGIIAILAAIVIIAINPAKQFAQARNTQRTSNVNAILNAVGQRIADNKGVFQGSFTVSGTTYVCDELPASGATVAVKSDNATAIDPDDEIGQLGCLIPTYIPALPTDPTWVSGDGTDTLYDLKTETNGRTTVCAPLSDSPGSEPALPNAPDICVTR